MEGYEYHIVSSEYSMVNGFNRANEDKSLFMINFEDPTLQPRAVELGKKAREILQKGSGVPELRTYVNYAQVWTPDGY